MLNKKDDILKVIIHGAMIDAASLNDAQATLLNKVTHVLQVSLSQQGVGCSDANES